MAPNSNLRRENHVLAVLELISWENELVRDVQNLQSNIISDKKLSVNVLKVQLSFFVGPFQLRVTELHNHPRVSSSVEFFLDIRTEDLLYQIIESRGANGDEDGSGSGIHPHSTMVYLAIAIINFPSH